MRIAVIGAHKVGKTTLAEDLLEHLPGYVLHKEPYYELEESGYIFAEMPAVDDFIRQFEYSVEQIQAGGSYIIFDRSPIDLLAYIHAIDETKDIVSLFETAREILSTIDLVVFVPIETPDLITCQHSDFPKLRYKVNEILDSWTSDLDINVIEVSGTISDRRDRKSVV